MINWTEVAKYFITLLIGSGTIGFIVKGMFNYFIEKDIEGYKSRLTILSKQREISFAKLYNERASAVKTLYKKLFKTDFSFKAFHSPIKAMDAMAWQDIQDGKEGTIGGKTISQLGNEAAENYNILKLYFEENRILFDDDVCQMIDNILSELYDIRTNFQIADQMKSYPQQQYEEIKKNWAKLAKEEIPELKKSLEKKFRDLLRHEINLSDITI